MIDHDITLIIAEDDDAQYILTERYLRQSGLNNKIIRFNNGGKLQAFLGSSKIIQNDLKRFILILDIEMPIKNGIEVLSYMKQNNLLDQIPTIMFSTYSDIETNIKCFNLGSRDFVSKPPGLDLIESITDVAKNFAYAV